MATCLYGTALFSRPGTETVGTGKPGRILPAQKAPSNFMQLSVPVPNAAQADLCIRPAFLLFGGLKHPSLRLRKPIPLKVDDQDGTVSVVWLETNEFGSGETLSEALDDFAATLIELQARLSQERESFSRHLLDLKQTLSEYISPRPR